MTPATFRMPALRLAWLTDLAAAIDARRGSRVIAVYCPACGSWVKPRRFQTPANLCRTCHRGPDTRTWTRQERP